jgi:hypothetical protein
MFFFCCSRTRAAQHPVGPNLFLPPPPPPPLLSTFTKISLSPPPPPPIILQLSLSPPRLLSLIGPTMGRLPVCPPAPTGPCTRCDATAESMFQMKLHTLAVSAAFTMTFLRALLCALGVAALLQCVVAQRLAASTCSACVAMNGVSIYSDTTRNTNTESPADRYVYSTGIGTPTTVWCSAEPAGDSGTCSETSFIVANLQTQCGGWASPAQASPCPAAAPFAFFQSCDCARTCKYQGLAFDGYGSDDGDSHVSRAVVPETNVVNLLRSCDLCVAAGGEWWSASDLKSTACSNVSYQLDHHNWVQTVVPSCHAPGQRFLTARWTSGVGSSIAPDVSPFQPAFRYSTSYQCSHGSSFCSSISMPGANCLAMVVLLLNVPFSAFYCKLSRIARKFQATVPGSSDTDSAVSKSELQQSFGITRSASLGLFASILYAFDECCSATTPIARRRNLVAEYLVTFIFWPVAFAFALLPLGFFILCYVFYVIPVKLLYVVLILPLKWCWTWCGGESPGAAPPPDNSSAASGVAMVNIAELPHSDPSSETTNTLQDSDTAFSTTRVTMTDDELSPLINRHIEARTRELRSQMQEMNSRIQEMNARSLRTEAQLGELLSRGYSNSLPH